MLDLVKWFTVIEEIKLAMLEGPSQRQAFKTGLFLQLSRSGNDQGLAVRYAATDGEPEPNDVIGIGKVTAFE